MVLAFSVGFTLRVVIGLVIMVVLARIGFGIIGSLAEVGASNPDPGEMRQVRVKYRCEICGVELRLTLAPDDDPPPPVHCLEEMALIPPTFE